MQRVLRSLLFRLGILFAFWACNASAGFNQVPAEQALDQLANLALKITRNKDALMALRPTYGECRQLCSSQDAALRLWDYANGFYNYCDGNDIPLKFAPKGAKGVKSDPGRLASLRKHFSKKSFENQWYGVHYWEKNETELENKYGFSGFTKLGERWIFIPRIDQAFSGEKPDFYEVVLELFSRKRYDELYDLCSSRITEQLPRKDATKYFAKLGIGEITSLKWQNKGFRSGIDSTIYNRGVSLEFRDGRATDVNIIITTEEDELRLVWIGTFSRLGIDPPDMYLPTPKVCISLAKQTFETVVDGISKDDFEVLFNQSSKTIRERFKVEDLKKAFEETKKHSARLTEFKSGTFSLKKPPGILRDPFSKPKFDLLAEKTPPSYGPLKLRVAVEDPKSKQKIELDLTYYYEDKEWKPSGYSIIGLDELK